MQLGAIIIERGRRIADREAHPVEIERIVANQVSFEPLKRQGSAFSSSAHLAQSGDTLVGFDFHHRSNKAAPMGPVAVAQRRLKRNRDSRSLDISDLHRSALFHQANAFGPGGNFIEKMLQTRRQVYQYSH